MKAMILAAGRGERMRPLTDTTPKPMLTVNNKPLIVWHIEALARAGIRHIVINHAWLGEVITKGLGNGSQWGVEIAYSAETTPLETAGGIATALPLLTDHGQTNDPFFVINGDVFCPDFQYNQLHSEAKQLVSAKQLAKIYLIDNPEHHPQGDFYLDNGLAYEHLPEHLQHRRADESRLTFAGIAIYRPILFAGIVPHKKAALAPLLRAEMANGTIAAERLTCNWTDVGTPERLAQLQTLR